MAFTSFNLSRFSTIFRRAVAALGFGTDSAIRARVQTEAQSSAVWARFAPGVAGSPALPRVAGNIQIDEAAALVALSGGSVLDVLSYTAPVFKAGHTLVPLSEFSFGVPFDDAADGGIMAQFADDWGYTFDLPRGDVAWVSATTPPTEWDTPGKDSYKKIAFANANPGRFVISTKTRAIFSQEASSITESIFDPNGIGYSYCGLSGRAQNLNNGYLLGGSLFSMATNTGAFLRSPTTRTLIKVNGRAMLKPDFPLYDSVGTAAWIADETLMVSELNSRLTGGNSITSLMNGAEYQPYPYASASASFWAKNTAYTVGKVVRTPAVWAGNTAYLAGAVVHVSGAAANTAYTCTTGGTSAASGGPTGTGTGITDGSCVWDYTAAYPSRVYVCITAGTSANTTGAGPLTTSADITDGSAHWEYCADGAFYWYADDNTAKMLAAAIAQPNSDPGNTAYLDAIFSAYSTAEASLRTSVKSAGVDNYIVYLAGDEIEGILGSSRSDGRRQRSIYLAPYPYAVTPTQRTDQAGWEFYRGYVTSYTAFDSSNGGFRGVTLPEYVTNCAAQNIESGANTMNPFVAGVWNGGAGSEDDDLYMGFLKFIYACGCVGVVPGYYSVGPNNGTWTIGSGACDQVRQYCTIGHVHATFSHLENYIRSGTLLDGDYDAWSLGSSSHILSKNIYSSSNGFVHPSYEYAHNDTYQWYSKVVARKLNASNDWLICAWRCYDGTDATLSVTVAGHALSVNARRCGTLYHMDNSGTLTMLDPLGMDPSRSIETILAGL